MENNITCINQSHSHSFLLEYLQGVLKNILKINKLHFIKRKTVT